MYSPVRLNLRSGRSIHLAFVGDRGVLAAFSAGVLRPPASLDSGSMGGMRVRRSRPRSLQVRLMAAGLDAPIFRREDVASAVVRAFVVATFRREVILRRRSFTAEDSYHC